MALSKIFGSGVIANDLSTVDSVYKVFGSKNVVQSSLIVGFVLRITGMDKESRCNINYYWYFEAQVIYNLFISLSFAKDLPVNVPKEMA